jgi:hypothetical protein
MSECTTYIYIYILNIKYVKQIQNTFNVSLSCMKSIQSKKKNEQRFTTITYNNI